MKNQIPVAISVITMLAACTETSEVITPDVENGDGVFATLEQPVSVVTKSFTYENDKLVFTWGEGENLMAIGDGDVAMFRTVNAGEASSKLESKGFQLMDDVDYYAYIPAKSLPSSEKEVPVTLLGQRQTTNNNSAHLKEFDYACAKATKDVNANFLSFNLSNQIGWIILEHTFAEAENIVSVTISATDDIFVTEGILDVTSSTISAKTRDNEITLALGEEGGTGLEFATGDTFRGFFTVVPLDLSGQSLTITATTRDGKSIELGTFEKENAKIEKNKFGVILTQGTAVATVDGKEYSSLKDAVAAATEGSTINVVSDVTTEKVSIDKSVTFDLGGNTVTADDDVFYITKDGLTVKFMNGNIVSTKESGLFFKQGCQNENITFDNCNLTGVEGAIATSTLTGSTITINGGTFISSNNAVILTNGNKRMYPYDETNTALRENPNTIIINGGTFKGQMSDKAYNDRNAIACGIYAAWKDNIIVNDGTFDIERGVGVLCRGGKVTIKGGTFTTTDPDKKTGRVGDSRVVVPCQTVYVDKDSQYPDYENATIEISGGKFSDNACKDYLAEGYGIGQVYDQTKNIWYTEVAEAVLEYDGVKYSSLQAAIEASEDATKEITILKDMEVSQLTVYSENKVTINLNGKNVNIPGYTADCTGVNIDGGSLTIKGSGSFGDSAQKNVNPLFYVSAGASLTIEGDASYYSANVCAYARYSNSKIYINGGKWYGSETYTLNKYDTNQEATISVTGGEFYKYNPAASHSENPVANFVADGYGVVKDGDWYKVVEATVATDEASLTSAISKDGAISVNESIVIKSKPLSITGEATSIQVANNSTISSEYKGSSYYKTLSYFHAGGLLCGEGTIVAPDVKNETTCAIEIESGKELIINGNLTIKGNVAGTEDAPQKGMASAIIIRDGRVVINGGHFIGGKDRSGGTCPAIILYSSGTSYNATLIINNGVFEAATDDATFLINCDSNSKGTNVVQIKGGTFVGFNPADNNADGEHTHYVADGYVSTKITYNGKDAWVVTKAK